MKYLFFLFSIFIVYSTYSQKRESTIYFTNGDTIKSLATMRKGKIVTFDYNGKKEKLDYRTVSHIDYGQGQATGIYYYKIQNGYNIPKLVELYKEGNLCLYGIRAMYQSPGFGYQTTTIYYVGRKEESTITNFDRPKKIAGKGFEEYALAYFNECESIRKKIEEKVFKKFKLPELAEFYNSSCKNKI